MPSAVRIMPWQLLGWAGALIVTYTLQLSWQQRLTFPSNFPVVSPQINVGLSVTLPPGQTCQNNQAATYVTNGCADLVNQASQSFDASKSCLSIRL